MKKSDFYFELPEDLIAQTPIQQRDASRLLVLDKKTGNQYIGSTYNQDGIFGRWKNYADTKDGGDVGLKELLKSRPDAYKNFQYTILRVLSKCITPEEAINIESLYKEKLGTRVYGLNMN